MSKFVVISVSREDCGFNTYKTNLENLKKYQVLSLIDD